MQIWKHELPQPGQTIQIETPSPTPLHVAVDPKTGRPAWWVAVDPSAPAEIVRVTCIGTGHDFPVGSIYLGTIIDPSGFVWHWLVLR